MIFSLHREALLRTTETSLGYVSPATKAIGQSVSNLRCLSTVVAILLHAGFSATYAQSGAEEFQDDTLQIVPENTSASLPNLESAFGEKRGFEGDAARIVFGQPKGLVRFNFRPRLKRNLVVSTGMSTVEYPTNSWFAQQLHESIRIISGPVDKGKVVPMFGTLYKVATIEDDERGGYGVAMKLQKLARHERPRSAKLDPYAYAIMHGGWLDIPSTLNQPEILVNFESPELCVLTVRGEHVGISQGKGRWSAHSTTKKVVAKVGKPVVVPLGQANVLFRVVSIAYPNEKSQLTGWVEVRRVWPSLVPFGATVKPQR